MEKLKVSDMIDSHLTVMSSFHPYLNFLGPKPLTQVIHDLRKMPPRSKAVATKKISTGIPSKGIVTTPVRIPSARVPSAKPKSATVKARPKSPKANVPSSSSTIP